MDKYIFAITGTTGSGKSTISDIFRNLGVYVADADKAARAVTTKGHICLDEIVSEFGNNVLNSDGTLNRPALANIVFNDNDKLKLLNNITHKYIKEYLLDEIFKADNEIAAIDGAVIIGSPVCELCKATVVVTADEDIRANRIMKRDNITLEAALSRIRSQMKDDEYTEYADYIIKNNDDNVGLEECIERIYSEIKNIREAEATQNASQKTKK